MTIRSKLRVVFLVFGMLPLGVLAVVVSQSALGASRDFYNAMAIALMVTALAGLLEPGFLGRWLFARQIERMRSYCSTVREGRYDSFLEVPNEKGSGQGENELIALMRDMNWMVHRIKTNSTDLQSAVSRLTASKEEIQKQKAILEEVNAVQLATQNQLQEKTVALTEAVSKIRGLLDNAGQGFLSIGEDLRVAKEYSAECVLIFSQEIEKQWLPELLYPQDPGRRAFLEALLKKLFSEADRYQQDNYFSLLPEELVVDGSALHLSYKWLPRLDETSRQEMLIILTDRSEQKHMEQKMQAERDVLSMVVKAATHRQDFRKSLAEYEVFCRQELGRTVAGNGAVYKKINAIFRAVHTWKGAFGQMGMLKAMAKLHELETELAVLREHGEEATAEDLAQCFARYTPEVMISWLYAEVEQLQAILGSDFFREDELIVIENEKLLRLEEKVKRTLTPCKARALVCELRKLRHRSLAELLSLYPGYVRELAVKQGKEIFPVVISGDIVVDPERYHGFVKALVHVFRNAVAHGLETPEERLLKGKAPEGCVYCRMEERQGKLLLCIGDDGRGMEAARLTKRAVEQNLCTQEEAANYSEEEALQLIFADGFSSAELPDELSGRGVGLSALKKEVDQLDGRIRIETKPGNGTEFLFSLPLQEESDRDEAQMIPWSERLVETAAQLLREEYQLEVECVQGQKQKTDDIELKAVSAFIEMTGAFSGCVICSVDENMAAYLAATASQQAAYVEKENNWADSVLGEFLNHAVGVSARGWAVLEEELEIGAPAVIRAQNAAVYYQEARRFAWRLESEAGVVQLYLVFFNGKEGD